MAKKSHFLWKKPTEINHDDLLKLQEETGFSQYFLTLCLQRNLTTKAAIDNFLNSDLENLHDPYLLYDMKKAVKRIQHAIKSDENILVYGDYDADGITSTTVLVETLESLGANVQFYLPNRFIDGYGPNLSVYQYMIDFNHIDLIITCDNGVSGHEAIAYSMSKGVDVIITDHHELPETLPNAYAIIHPRHPKGQYPFGDLAGVGVAFKVACALLGELPTELLDITAIGTIADLVDVTGENRILIKYGLECLRQTSRLGLLHLIDKIGVTLENMTIDTIGFGIGPRLNAIGRLEEAKPGVDLLMTFDDEEALQIVNYIEEKNDERKKITDKINQDIDDYLATLDSVPNFILLANENWHPGVLGIVASRVVEKTGKPTILLHIDKETGLAKGSGRSVDGVNLFDLLSQCKESIEKFGGHHMAAGMTVKVTEIDRLSKRLIALTPHDTQVCKSYDLTITTDDLPHIDVRLIHEIDKLAPFGTNHTKPIILLENVHIDHTKLIGEKQQHLKGNIAALDFIYFNGGHEHHYLSDNVTANLYVTLAINEWQNIKRVQCIVEDTAINGIQFFDRRSSTIKPSHLTIPHATYICFNEAFYHYFKDKVVKTSQMLLHHEINATHINNMVLFDCPSTLSQLNTLLSAVTVENIYVQFHIKKSKYLLGKPNRTQFGLLYKYIATKKTFVIKDTIEQLMKQFNMQKDLIILIFKVFYEAKFVTIEQGILSFNTQHEKASLELTTAYQQHIEQIILEQQLIFSDFSKVCELLKQ